MTQVISKSKVRDAVARALLLDPAGGEEQAIAAAAQALGIDVDAVREALLKEGAEA